MALTLRPWTPADTELLRELVCDPSLAPQFDQFQGPLGLEHKLHDPRLAADGLRLAFVDGEPAGFALAWALHNPNTRWFMIRIGVIERYRRQGVGRRLAAAMLAYAREDHTRVSVEISASAWVPNEAAEGLAAALGFAHERWFWMMERPRGVAPDPRWPAGIVTRELDGSERMLREWTDIYNDSFAQHYRFSPSGIDVARTLAADSAFRPDGMLLAYLGDTCVGFCRNELHAARGEIGVLGVAHSARGTGLGRALLRWGVGWIEANTPAPVTLLVDGENESALGLYRSEGFAIARTRRIWSAPAVRS